MVSTLLSQSMHPGQWRKAIGRLRLISINAPAISRPKPRCDFHGRSGRTHGTVGATDRQEPRGEKKVPITYRIEGNKRFAEIPNILHMSVDPLPTAHPSGEIWANTGHPVSPDKLAFATGAPGNTFTDHGMRWDNSGKNGHYAPIRWSNRL